MIVDDATTMSLKNVTFIKTFIKKFIGIKTTFKFVLSMFNFIDNASVHRQNECIKH